MRTILRDHGACRRHEERALAGRPACSLTICRVAQAVVSGRHRRAVGAAQRRGYRQGARHLESAEEHAILPGVVVSEASVQLALDSLVEPAQDICEDLLGIVVLHQEVGVAEDSRLWIGEEVRGVASGLGELARGLAALEASGLSARLDVVAIDGEERHHRHALNVRRTSGRLDDDERFDQLRTLEGDQKTRGSGRRVWFGTNL